MCVCVCRVGDVLESVNGHSLNNAHHAQAVAVVKESKGLLDIVSIHTHTHKYALLDMISIILACLGR